MKRARQMTVTPIKALISMFALNDVSITMITENDWVQAII